MLVVCSNLIKKCYFLLLFFASILINENGLIAEYEIRENWNFFFMLNINMVLLLEKAGKMKLKRIEWMKIEVNYLHFDCRCSSYIPNVYSVHQMVRSKWLPHCLWLCSKYSQFNILYHLRICRYCSAPNSNPYVYVYTSVSIDYTINFNFVLFCHEM